MMKRLAISILSLLLVITMLPLNEALAAISTDSEFRPGEQAYILKVGGMDGNAVSYTEGMTIATDTNARTVQDWADKLTKSKVNGLETICNELLDNCTELLTSTIPVKSNGDLNDIAAVQTAVDSYLSTIEPTAHWLEWCSEKLDYNRQRVDYLIRTYNAGGLDERDMQETVRSCRNLTEEIMAIVIEASQKQAALENSLAAVETQINTTLCAISIDPSQLDPAALQLISIVESVRNMASEMDRAATSALSSSETSYAQSQGQDIEVQVVASDEWAALVYDSDDTDKHLEGVKVKVTSEDKSIVKEYTTDREGKVVLKYTDFKPKSSYAVVSLEFIKDGYRYYVVEKTKIFGADGARFYLSEDDGNPYIISSSFDEVEFLHTKNTYYVTPKNDMDHTISLRVNTKGKTLKVWLNYSWVTNIVKSESINGSDVQVTFKDKWCNGKKIEAGTEGLRFYLTESTTSYQTYMIPAKFATSKIDEPKIEKSNAAKFAPGAALGIPESVLGIGKLDFALDLGLPEIQIMADVGGVFYMAIGDKLKEFDKEKYNWKSQSQKNQDDKIKELTKDNKMTKANAQHQIMKEGYASKKTKFLGNQSMTVNFMGSGRGKYDKNNGHVSIDGGGGVSFGAKVEFTWQFYVPSPVGAIPAFFSLDFGLEALFYADFGIEFDYPSFGNFNISSGSGLSLALTITIGATLGVGWAKIVNIYGRIYGTMGLSLYIGKSSRTFTATLGWGWEIGVQVFTFKAAWKHGPWKKDFTISNVNSANSSGSLSDYVVARTLNSENDQFTTLTYPLNENSASDFYQTDFAAYMDDQTQTPAETLDGAGIAPIKKQIVLGDISSVNQELTYFQLKSVDETYAMWITPNYKYSNGKLGPKLVWVNVTDPRKWGAVDLPQGTPGNRDPQYDICFDACKFDKDAAGTVDRILVAVVSAPVKSYTNEGRIVYDTVNANLSYFALESKSGQLRVKVTGKLDKDNFRYREIKEALSKGYLFSAVALNMVSAYPASGNIYQGGLSFSMADSNGQRTKYNDRRIYTGMNYTLVGSTDTAIADYNKQVYYIGEPNCEAYFQDVHPWPEWNNEFDRNAFLSIEIDDLTRNLKVYNGSHSNNSDDVLMNEREIKGARAVYPMYDKYGLMSSAIYLQTGQDGMTRLAAVSFGGFCHKMTIDVVDYDIVVNADHFKVSPTLVDGRYYVYWVEQSKGVDIGSKFAAKPKYSIMCTVYDAQEKIFSPAFALIETDAEVATSELMMSVRNDGDFWSFGIIPNADSSTYGPMAYVRGQLVGYQFDMKGIVDMVGAAPEDPVIGAGMENDILVRVTNPGNLPVSRFTMNVYHYVNNNKQLMKSFDIDCANPKNTTIDNYQYDPGGTITITSSGNDNHDLYQIPAVGDENDVLFINPVFTSTDYGESTATSSKPHYLKLLMPGNTRTYKATLTIPKDWRNMHKLYVEITGLSTVNPSDFLTEGNRNDAGELLDTSGNVIPEYNLGFDYDANGLPGLSIGEVTTADGEKYVLGRVEASSFSRSNASDTRASGTAVLTSTPTQELIGGYNDLWLNVEQHTVNDVEYSRISIGNRESDDETPAEPSTLIVKTDGTETYRYTFKESISGRYGYSIDVPTYMLSHSFDYDSMTFTVQNSAAFNEMDEFDNTVEVFAQKIEPTPTPTPVPVPPPITGDSANPVLWGALTAFALMMLVMLTAAQRFHAAKRTKKKEE